MTQKFTAEPVIPVREESPLWLRVVQWSILGAALAVMALYEFSGCPAAQTAQVEARHLTVLATDSQGRAVFCAYQRLFSRTSNDLYDGPVAGMCAATRAEVEARVKAVQQGQADQFHGCLVRSPLVQKIRQLF